jgi:hypothetical protein
MVRLFRVTPTGTKLAGRLTVVEGRAQFCVEDPDAGPLFMELEHDGIASSVPHRWVKPEDGELFVDAVVDALRRTSYWVAERDNEGLAATGAMFARDWKLPHLS